MSENSFINIELPLPKNIGTNRYQSGITDPIWPVSPPDGFNADLIMQILKNRAKGGRISDRVLNSITADKLIESYDAQYSGRISRQKVLTILRANCVFKTRTELKSLLVLLSEISRNEMKELPSVRNLRILETVPDSYRVTITLGFGASLFISNNGCDRFNLAHLKPKYLKSMPKFQGDNANFDPKDSSSDFIILIASDHPYVNTAVAREFAKKTNKGKKLLDFFQIEQGFQRAGTREFLGFDDGINNISMLKEELEDLVYITKADEEPSWCENGSYMVYRKIKENMAKWENINKNLQERMIGRKKETGAPLSRNTTGPEKMTPVFPDPKDDRDGELNSHIRKVQPRRPNVDLFGIHDLDRRFLRRPYPFFDGFDANGESINGLQFIAYMRSIHHQFEHVTNMWQLNPDFPIKGAGADKLIDEGILSTIDGGYYFCPPGLVSESDYFGSELIEASELNCP